VEIVLHIGIAQSFFAGLMIVLKQKKILADHLLATWLWTVAFEMVLAYGTIYGFWKYYFPFIELAYGAIFYLYVSSIAGHYKKFKSKDLLHFMPVVIAAIISTIFVDKGDEDVHLFLEMDAFLPFRLFLGFSLFISILIYFLKAARVIKSYQMNIGKVYSYTSENVSLNWLKKVATVLFTAYILIFIVANAQMLTPLKLYDIKVVIYVALTLISFMMSFFGFRQPELFIHSLKNDSIAKKVDSSLKYSSSGLKGNELNELATKVKNYMDQRKPFLNGEITIYELSDQLSISRHHLTQVLNSQVGMNFYHFVNSYRVIEAKKILSDKKHSHLSIIGIGFEAGFNSKTTFNTFFKSHTGMTPSEYRRAQAVNLDIE